MSRTQRSKTDRFIRRPKTLQEKKKVADALDQGVKVRPKRKVSHLVDDYDDMIIAAKYEEIK